MGSLHWNKKACAQMKCISKISIVLATLGNYVVIRESNLHQQILILFILMLPLKLFINLADFWKAPNWNFSIFWVWFFYLQLDNEIWLSNLLL